MVTLFSRQTLVGVLLLLFCVTKLEALDLSRRVRGLSQARRTTGSLVRRSWERALQKGDKENIDQEEDDDWYFDDDDQKGDDEEDTDEEEVTEDNGDTDEGEPADNVADNETDNEENQNDNENDPVESAVEEPPQTENGDTLEEPEVFDDDDDDSAEGTDGNEYPEETAVPEIETAAPTSTPTVPENETDAPESQVGVFDVPLSPFTISIDYDEPVEEDPGIEEYLVTEMTKTFSNLVFIDMTFSGSAVDESSRRKLYQQVLSYSGYATFDGPPVRKEEEVQQAQAFYLANESAVSAVMAASLGETDAGNLAVSAIEVQNDSVQPGGSGGDSSSNSSGDEDNGLSTAGLVIVVVAAIIGGLSLTLICVAAFPRRTTDSFDVYDKKQDRALKLAPKLKDVEGGKEALGATFETDQASLNTAKEIHEQFATNMEKHSFTTAWKPGSTNPPVQAKSSVMRGTLVEKPIQSPESGDVPADESSTDLRGLNQELAGLSAGVHAARDKAKNLEMNMELNELQTSIKAAKEKTKKILDESNSPQKEA